jgi:WD40 repeat protein
MEWQPVGQGLYFTSCLTQCSFLSNRSLLTAGTDGHAAIWPLSSEEKRPSAESATSVLTWQQPVRIHQSSSKAMVSYCLNTSIKLIVSGGDDGSMALLLLSTAPSSRSTYAAAPVILSRTHASAVTACAIVGHEERIFIITSGNDQWLRLWEVLIRDNDDDTTPRATGRYEKSITDIRRMGKIKTNVADVSSIAVLGAEEDEEEARVLVCGVGMEVISVHWDVSHAD